MKAGDARVKMAPMKESRQVWSDVAILAALAIVSAIFQWPAFLNGDREPPAPISRCIRSPRGTSCKAGSALIPLVRGTAAPLTYAARVVHAPLRRRGSGACELRVQPFHPALFLLVPAYFAARRWTSRAGAILIGLVIASGNRFLAEQFHNDFYPPVLMLTFVFAALGGLPKRARARFALGVLSGLCLYTHRLSVIPILAFCVPWGFAGDLARDARARLQEGTRSEKACAWIGASLFALGVSLWIFGDHVGQYGGRNVRLDIAPNLKCGFVLLMMFPLWRARARISAELRASAHLGSWAFV